MGERPTFYVSGEAHDSFVKAARMTGLGQRAARSVPVGDDLRLDVDALRAAIERDRAAGERPFLVVATAGTTAGGIVDPLPAIADLCGELGLDLHVDAAWAGAAALSERLRPVLDGIERADSVTVDAHKWLSAPMGAGVFITRHPRDLTSTFRVAAGYMPSAESTDPYLTSAQWSRRFTGLKVFMSLAAAGRAGYAAQIERDCRLGDRLRDRLTEGGWRVVNETPLPVVCFVPGDDAAGRCRAGPHRRRRGGLGRRLDLGRSARRPPCAAGLHHQPPHDRGGRGRALRLARARKARLLGRAVQPDRSESAASRLGCRSSTSASPARANVRRTCPSGVHTTARRRSCSPRSRWATIATRRPLESKKVTSERSSTTGPSADSIAAVSSRPSIGAVAMSISPVTTTTGDPIVGLCMNGSRFEH